MTIRSRRRFIRQVVGGVVASASLPISASAWSGRRAEGSRLLADITEVTHGLPPYQVADEDFWRLVKRAFSLKPDLILMNAANLCPSPASVQERVFELTRDIDRDASFQNRAKLGGLRTDAREALAAFMGADAGEVAIVRNTSAANATVVNGMDMGPGDEVVLWDQNHPTNSVAWDVRAERMGFTVKRVATPPSPRTAQDLIRPFLDAFTSRTRLVSFSHVSNVSGVALPAAEMCRAARDRGVMSMVDGAQTFGAMLVDVHALGCDFYTGSAHKWFVGPKEAGLLYVRAEAIEGLWPTHVGVGWERARLAGAQKFENLGQRDDAAVAAVGDTVDFHEAIGRERAHERVKALAGALKVQLRDRVAEVHFHTPLDPELSHGVVVFRVAGLDSREAFGRLYSDHAIGGAAMGGDFEGIRLCPHIYNTMEEVERVVQVIASMA